MTTWLTRQWRLRSPMIYIYEPETQESWEHNLVFQRPENQGEKVMYTPVCEKEKMK